MQLLGKKIENITSEDLNRLIENQISESKTLDYKRDLKIDSNGDKKEFLYDIASFANTDGGVIIFGIEEEKDEKNQNTGKPSTVVGITIENDDKLKQKIEDMVKNSSDPQLTIPYIEVKILDGKKLLLLGIPKFIGLPFMVTFEKTNKFYKRNNTGKYLVDVHELNQMFMSNVSIKERANQFRENRVNEVRGLHFDPNLNITGSYFLHIIPLNNLGNNTIDVSGYSKEEYFTKNLKPIKSSGHKGRYNLDGFMTYAYYLNTRNILSYTQLFRDGSIEYFTTGFYFLTNTEGHLAEFDGGGFEKKSIESIRKAIEILQHENIEPPYAVFISLHDLENLVVGIGDSRSESTSKIGKPKIHFPAVLFYDIDVDIAKAMKTTFDILWQAGGFPNSIVNHDR